MSNSSWQCEQAICKICASTHDLKSMHNKTVSTTNLQSSEYYLFICITSPKLKQHITKVFGFSLLLWNLFKNHIYSTRVANAMHWNFDTWVCVKQQVLCALRWGSFPMSWAFQLCATITQSKTKHGQTLYKLTCTYSERPSMWLYADFLSSEYFKDLA